MSTITLQLVAIGDTKCGKSCLLMVFCSKIFPSEYVPTVSDSYSKHLAVQRRDIELKLLDTAGLKEHDRVRTLSYSGSHVILVCYSIDSPDSFENVTEKWIPEIERYCSGLPIVLVGLKKDLRDDTKTIEYLKEKGQQPVSTKQGRKLANTVKAAAFLECSALKRDGVHEVFNSAARAAIMASSKRCCSIL